MSYNDLILGKGIVFPFVLVNGRIVISKDVELIRASIVSILSWPYNTRYFNNIYGSKVKELLEEPNDTILLGLVKHFIVEAITKWETRITLLEPPDIFQEDHSIMLRIKYKIIKTAQEDSFVFPFYKSPKY